MENTLLFEEVAFHRQSDPLKRRVGQSFRTCCCENDDLLEILESG